MDYGFRVVISSRSADIFRGNAGKAGLLAAEVAQDDVDPSLEAIEQKKKKNPPKSPWNLQDRNITRGTVVVVPFTIDDYKAWRLPKGLTILAFTLRKLPDIENFERPGWSRRF